MTIKFQGTVSDTWNLILTETSHVRVQRASMNDNEKLENIMFYEKIEWTHIPHKKKFN